MRPPTGSRVSTLPGRRGDLRLLQDVEPERGLAAIPDRRGSSATFVVSSSNFHRRFTAFSTLSLPTWASSISMRWFSDNSALVSWVTPIIRATCCPEGRPPVLTSAGGSAPRAGLCATPFRQRRRGQPEQRISQRSVELSHGPGCEWRGSREVEELAPLELQPRGHRAQTRSSCCQWGSSSNSGTLETDSDSVSRRLSYSSLGRCSGAGQCYGRSGTRPPELGRDEGATRSVPRLVVLEVDDGRPVQILSFTASAVAMPTMAGRN